MQTWRGRPKAPIPALLPPARVPTGRGVTMQGDGFGSTKHHQPPAQGSRPCSALACLRLQAGHRLQCHRLGYRDAAATARLPSHEQALAGLLHLPSAQTLRAQSPPR